MLGKIHFEHIVYLAGVRGSDPIGQSNVIRSSSARPNNDNNNNDNNSNINKTY